MNLTRTSDASAETLSLVEVRSQLKILGSDDDDSFRMFIAGIRKQTETYLAQTLVDSTWELKIDEFQEQMVLPMKPIQSISSIVYVDDDGDTQTLSADQYQFDKQGRLMPAYDKDWPDTREQYDAVTITYVAGNEDPGQVDDDIKLAMLMWIGSCDINREDVVVGPTISEIPNSAKTILAPHRAWHSL